MSDLGTIEADRAIKDLERRIADVYAEAEKDLNQKLDTFVAKFEAKQNIHLQELKEGKITKADYDAWIQGQIFQRKQWETKRDQIVRTMTKTNEIATNLINGKMTDVFTFNANYMSYDIEHGAGIDFGFGLYDSASVGNLLKNEPQILPKWKIDEKKDYIWNEKQVNNAVTQGIIQGERLDQISKRLTEGLSAKNEDLMKTFARTGMTEAQNAGRLYQIQEAEEKGIKVEKEWMATLDGHTRDSHRSLDGETVPVNVKFSNGCMYPGDPHGPAHEVYNCRCTMVSDVKDYPDEYKRYDNIEGKPIRNMTYTQWESIKKSEKATNIHINLPTPSEFKRDFDLAKSTIPAGQEWRVDDTYTVDDYKHKTLFELDGGSVVAVTEDGDIVSVCKKLNVDPANDDIGSQMLKVAVANGGVKLDAFGPDLYKFYTKNGFEPVSWTPFNEEYAPHDWVKGRDKHEPVIFYRYTGKQPSISYDEFLFSTKACEGPDGYDDAKIIRDRLIDSMKQNAV